MCANLYSAATGDHLPSSEMIKLLTEVLYEMPDLGDALLRAIGLVHVRLEIHIACLHHSLDELSDIDTAGNASTYELNDVATARFYKLLALFDISAKEASERKAELHQLWLRIANVLSSGTCGLERSAVLSCLLAQKSQTSRHWFIKLLDNADLQCLISRNAETRLGFMHSDLASPSCTAAVSSFTVDNTVPGENEETVVSDDSVCVLCTADETEMVSNLPSNIGDDTVLHIMALLLTASQHATWYHLYLTCFERRMHFLDLFLVCNTR